MPGQLSTHILDTANGGPAAGVKLTLRRDGQVLVSTTTNADGRTDAPLLSDEALQIGSYELDFHMGDYFRARGHELPDPAFVDVVTLRFGVASPNEKYHVPLLTSPWSYSTYRGS